MYMQIIVCKMDPTFQHILRSIFCALPSLLGNHWTLPEKQTNRRGGRGGRLRRDIFDTPWNFFFTLTLPLEIPDKTKHSTPGYYKIMLDPLEIPRPKTETPPGNSAVFSWSPLEIPLCF